MIMMIRMLMTMMMMIIDGDDDDKREECNKGPLMGTLGRRPVTNWTISTQNFSKEHLIVNNQNTFPKYKNYNQN